MSCFRWITCILWASVISAWTVQANQSPHHERLGGFDKRARKAEKLQDQRAAAAQRLKDKLPPLKLEVDDLTGSPKIISASAGFLTGPKGEGKAVPPERMKLFPAGDPHRVVKAFVQEHSPLFEHGPEVFEKARVNRDYKTAHNGLRTVVWQQEMDGIKVDGAVFIGQLTKDEELVSISSQFLPDPEKAAEKGTPRRKEILKSLSISAKKAVELAAANVEQQGAEVDPVDEPVHASKRQRFKGKGIRGEAMAELIWLPLDRERLRLCWEVQLARVADGEGFTVIIDADSGEALVRRQRTFYLSEATYHVFTSDSPTAFSPGHPQPSTNQPPVVPRSLVTLGALNTNASPIGWINDGENETWGNNVLAHTDIDADDSPDLPRPQGNPTRVFDFPIDFTQNPDAYRPASVVQLFYWCNWMHDKLYDLGFNEAAGNMQKDNFGRGGQGNDPLVADAQDGGGRNNANYTAWQEGFSPRIQMYVFDGSDPYRDGSFDADVVLHEYAHGLSDRLVGGGVGIYINQTFGLGEGWSDFYALALLSEASDDVDGVYTEGGYLSYKFRGLEQNYYYGIRRYPYTTDLNKNPLRFEDIDPTKARIYSDIPMSPIHSPNPAWASEPHRQGEFWCVSLWEARANLIRKHGFETGNRLILQLVTDGMRLSPPNPNFLQARDGVLLADEVNTGGANQAELWAAFAKRGMGRSAIAPSSFWLDGFVEAFDVPDQLTITPVGGLTFSGPPGGPLAPACRSLTATNSTTNTLRWTANGTQPYLNVLPNAGTLPPGTGQEITVCLTSNVNQLAVGTHQFVVSFVNPDTGSSQLRSVYVEVMNFAQMPFRETFENPLAPYWQISGSGSFRAERTEEDLTAHLGYGQMRLGNRFAGIYARNEFTLGLDLAGYRNVKLRFWARENLENPDGPPPVPFVDGANFDGVAISEDGVRWYEVQSLRNLQTIYSEYTVNLDAALATHGLAYNDSFRIRFNQAGNTKHTESAIFLDDIQIDGEAPARFAFHVPAYVREGDGVIVGGGQVFLPGPASSNITVHLSSSDPTAVILPSNVVIMAGSSNAFFDLNVVDDAVFDDSQFSTLIASAPGFFSAETVVEVGENESGTLTIRLPASGIEGQTLEGLGLVTVQPAPVRPVNVRLASSVPGQLQVPARVTIPAGQTSAVFNLAISNDGEINGTRRVAISGRVDEWPESLAHIDIIDDEAASLTLALPVLASEGATIAKTAFTVRLGGTLRSNLVVTLASANTNRMVAQPTVTIPAGSSSGTFTVTFPDNNASDGSASIQLTATAPGFSTGISSIRLIDNEISPVPYAPYPGDRSVSNALAQTLSWSSGVAEPLPNGDFENGALDGWSKLNSGQGDWVINSGTNNPPGPGNPVAPHQGRFSAMTQQSGQGQHVLYRDIVLPLYVDSVILDWTDMIQNHASRFASNQNYRVEIQEPGGETYLVAFSTQPGDPLFSDWTERTVNLTPYRGLAVRIAFMEEDSIGALNVHLDNVRLLLNFPASVEYDVYFGTNASLLSQNLLGRSSATTWELPALELNTSYYWQVISYKAGISAPGPIWQFRTRGIGPVAAFTWSSLPGTAQAGTPFSATLTARDDQGNVVTTFNDSVWLSAESTDLPDPVQILVYNPPGVGDHRRLIGAINYYFTNINVTSTELTDGASLQRLLTTQDIFLMPPQRFAASGQMAAFGAAWSGALSNFVTRGGTVIVTSYNRDEHQLLLTNGLLPVIKTNTFRTTDLFVDTSHPLTAGLPERFTGHYISSFFPLDLNAAPLIKTVGTDNPVVLMRELGAGRIILLGTDFTTNRTAMDRFLANCVQELASAFYRPMELSVPFSGYFENGVWTGNITVQGVGQGIRLRAEDMDGHNGVSAAINVSAANDLGVRLTDTPSRASVGQEITYVATVTNTGPGSISDVRLTQSIPPGASLLNYQVSQGSCSNHAETITCLLAPLGGGATATLTVTIKPTTPGKALSEVRVTGNPQELYLQNNVAQAISQLDYPRLSVSDPVMTEADEGLSDLHFAVTLFPPSSQQVSFEYFTTNGTAKAVEDYIHTEGVLTFEPGQTNLFIGVRVVGDTLNELGEGFQLRLRNVSNALLGEESGIGFIIDNDPQPAISIESVSLAEGPAGRTTNALFKLALSSPSGQPVSVRFATTNGSARAPLDFIPESAIVTFPAGVVTQAITVRVIGDNTTESNETFAVRLSSPQNATIATAEAIASILDDDVATLSHFEVSSVAATQYLGQPFEVTVSARDGLGNSIPTFSGNVQLGAMSGQKDLAIGNGGISWEFPFGSSSHDQRLQTLYLAEELGDPGRITALDLFVSAPPGQVLNRWTVRIKHSSLSAFTSPAWESNDWTTVYQSDEVIISSGWLRFPFRAPFDYNGVENLMIDFSFNNASFSPDGLSLATPTRTARSLVFATDSAFGDPLAWSGSEAPPPVSIDRIPNIRLALESTVTLDPEQLANFQNGSWTGNVVVRGVAERIALRADDGASHTGVGNFFTVLAENDLSVKVSDSPDPVQIGERVNYTILVTNSGPSAATHVTLTNFLGANCQFIEGSPGCIWTNGQVICDLGNIPGGEAKLTQVAYTVLQTGVLTNRTFVSRQGEDAYAGNNFAVTITQVSPPRLSVADVSVTEPDDGQQQQVVFDVRLSGVSPDPVSVDVFTVNGSATLAKDFNEHFSTIHFLPGTTNALVTLDVLGDGIDETNEIFYLRLDNPMNAGISKEQGACTIIDNDAPPTVIITNTAGFEGHSGTSNLTVHARLSHPSALLISFGYSTSNGTAVANSDFTTANATLIFPPSLTNRFFNIPVRGDREVESNETFFLNLRTPSNCSLETNRIQLTIVNDDGLAGQVDHFAWSPLAPTQLVNRPFPVTVTARDYASNTLQSYSAPVSLQGRIGEPDITFGASTANAFHPFATGYHDSRAQIIYPASDLGAKPRRLVGFSLDVSLPPGQTMNNFTIRLKHTTLNAYNTPAFETNGWTLVYRANRLIESPGWADFVFSTPFEFNGTNNLLVDVSFDNSYFTSDGLCRAAVTASQRMAFFQSDSNNGDPLNWSPANTSPGLTTLALRTRFLGGFPVAITPSASSSFVNGVWSGNVTVLQPAEGMTLRADDNAAHIGISSAFSAIIDPDADQDGLLDDWERQFFGSTQAEPGQDSDNDGLTNRAEFLAGTDPTNPNSVLLISSVRRADNQVQIQFHSSAGRRYTLERSSSLQPNTWTVAQGDIQGNGAIVHLIDAPPAGNWFYRIRLQP